MSRATRSPSVQSRRLRARRLRAGGIGLLVVGVGTAGWFALDRATRPSRPHRCTATVDGRSVDAGPEQMGNAATIAGIAVRRGLPARAATIGIATAIQESKLVNVDYGDRDSLGLFQQRPSQGWGTAAEVRDPVHATNAFYDVLVKVDDYRSKQVTEVAQEVQRSAYPEAYADHEPDARVLASALTGQSPAALTCTLDLAAAPSGANGVAPLRRALAAELTRAPAAPLDGVAGVRVSVAEGTATWAAAQWSVAQAERLGVARVYADGRAWVRTDAEPRWRSAPDAGPGVVVLLTDAAPPPA